MKFLDWYQYFLINRNHFDHLNWEESILLTANERQLILTSIQQFQRGEHSEGKHFMQFAKSLNDKSYIDTVRLFIKEEQDHAAVLGKFMEHQKIKKLNNDWLDNVFRQIRKLSGLEGTVTVLLTAEIVSMIYYKALYASTQNTVLRQICNQILKDEKMHLRFQSYTLGLLYKKKKASALFISKCIHKILMAGTIVMVWNFHRKVMQAGGYHFFSCFNEIWKEFKCCNKMIKGIQVSKSTYHYINYSAQLIKNEK